MNNAVGAAAEQALDAAPPRRTIAFVVDDKRYIVKRMAAQSRSFAQTVLTRWLVKRVTGQTLSYRSLALSDATTGIAYEAKRIRALAAAGVQVPRIVAEGPRHFVMEHCGPDVATLIETWDRDTWRRELIQVARDLGAFHSAGHWHGGAQIKNVTWRNGLLTRIDFEESFGEHMPLAVTQTIDLVTFLNSVSLAGPVHEAESRELLPVLLREYFLSNRQYATEVRHVLDRALPLLGRLLRVARLFRRWSRKSIRRVEILFDVLKDFQQQT